MSIKRTVPIGHQLMGGERLLGQVSWGHEPARQRRTGPRVCNPPRPAPKTALEGSDAPRRFHPLRTASPRSGRVRFIEIVRASRDGSRRIRIVAAVLALSAMASAAADQGSGASADSSRDPLVEGATEKAHLTGDWGGWRTRLVERGIHFQAGYIGEGFGNLTGGLRRGAVYEGLGEAAVELDFARLTTGWKGARFRVSALYPQGRSPSRELAGDAQTLSNIDAYDSLALYELWFEQNVGPLSLRAGQLLADVEFSVNEAASALLNSSFGWPAFISINTRNTGPAFFRAAPGVRVRADPVPTIYVQAGVYDGDTFDNDQGRSSGNPHGINFRLSEHQGAFALAEVGVRLNQEEGASGLPGSYKIGGWYHTGTFSDSLDPAREHSGNHGVFAAAEQMVWRESDVSSQGVSLFSRVGASPEDRSPVSLAWDAGVEYRGLFPGRDDDALVLGVAMITISDEARRAERIAGASVISDHEIAVELTYQWNLRSWLTIQPDLQWIHHPGGSKALDDAFLVGVRSRVTF